MSLPASAPEHCPGASSAEAGKASPCQGCPNQRLCASGAAAAPDPDVARIRQRLSSVRHKLLVLSGKGGVGKSTVSCCLARALAMDSGKQVGLLDADICGPSLPTMLGLLGESVHQSGSGWSPVFVEENVCVMSIGFLLSSPDDSVVWRGPRKSGLLRQFLRDVDWSGVEFLVIDTPPGTSDEHLSIVQLLADAGIDGAVVVTTPQEVALMDVRKEVNFCRRLGVRVLGLVENLATFRCPNCRTSSALFPATTGGAAAFCERANLALLGSLPIEPELARACDQGESPFDKLADSEALATLRSVAKQLRDMLEQE